MENKTRTGTPMALTNMYGRQERYLLLETRGDVAMASTKDGSFQALRRRGESWDCVKMPQADEARAWNFIS